VAPEGATWLTNATTPEAVAAAEKSAIANALIPVASLHPSLGYVLQHVPFHSSGGVGIGRDCRSHRRDKIEVCFLTYAKKATCINMFHLILVVAMTLVMIAEITA